MTNKTSGVMHAVVMGMLMAYVLIIGSTKAFAADRVILGNPQPVPLAASSDPTVARTLTVLREQIATKGATRIIIGVRVAFAPEGLQNAASAAQQRSDIAQMQLAVLNKAPSLRRQSLKRFETIPFMALEVDATELQALIGLSEITSIEEDKLAAPTLAESSPLIGASTAWASGYTGTGQTVAILDTGVDKTHPFLAGKVVSEACYSDNLCPDGSKQSTATGSGVNCTIVGQCEHGTHVAGIAAGKGSSLSGVAKEASVIAVQVFTQFGSSGLSSYYSDLNLGLERVYALRNTYAIAAVNMSLGGGQYFDQATCDSQLLSTKTVIDNLRSVNIATVIASGNNGFTNSISAPGCISSAISVGATWDEGAVDTVAAFSNSASFLNLLAPGLIINSSVPGGGYATYAGTSMAAPHVAGAWAILKQKSPSLTVSQGLNALASTGLAVTDSRNGIVKSRIQINAALSVVSAPLFRAYLASTGNDANPCTLIAPCRLLPAALAVVADGGEIWMLDSANYNTGPANITKSVTILAAPGKLGSVVAAGGNAINIATAGVKVKLRNLVIVPQLGAGGTGGINMTAGTSLAIENCLIANHLLQSGIFVDTAASVQVTNTTIRDNAYGLWLQNGARATVKRATISRNGGYGVYVYGSVANTTTTADIADSTINVNNSRGVYVYSINPTAVVKVSMHDSRAVQNGTAIRAQSDAGAAVTLSASNNVISNNNAGIEVLNAGSRVLASGNTISGNFGTGLSNSGGILESAGNNAVRNNTFEPSGTITIVATP